MRTRHIVILGVLMLIPQMAEAQLATLTVTVRGLQPPTGTVEVSLFDSAASFLQKPFLQASDAVDGKEETTAEFSGLVEGEYAVVVVHDENDNGMLDTGFLGFGGESFGYSNDAFSWLGRPSFDSAKISIGTDDLEIVINLD